MKILLICFACLSSLVNANETLALLKQPGHLAIVRHALAPGTGDPGQFDLEDCNTQRNLSQRGREQARDMGDLFRKSGIKDAHVFTSQWCRCRDTAKLLKLGKSTDMPALNSFFSKPANRAPQMKELRKWLENPPKDKPVILITHQVVITELTNIFPASGEIIILRQTEAGEWKVAGSVKTM